MSDKTSWSDRLLGGFKRTSERLGENLAGLTGKAVATAGEMATRLGLPSEARDFPVAARMLHLLGVGPIRLMTNNPAKVAALEAEGVTVAERVAHQLPANPHNAAGMRTDPPVSVPSPAGAMRAAIAAAVPPEDPPGMRVLSRCR